MGKRGPFWNICTRAHCNLVTPLRKCHEETAPVEFRLNWWLRTDVWPKFSTYATRLVIIITSPLLKLLTLRSKGQRTRSQPVQLVHDRALQVQYRSARRYDCSDFLVTLQKYPYNHGYFVASFAYFNGTGSVYVCICKSTRGPTLQCSVKIWKTRHKVPVDIRIFFTV